MGNFKVYLPDFMDNSVAPLWLINTLAQVSKKNSPWTDLLCRPYVSIRDQIPVSRVANNILPISYYVAQAAWGVIPFMVRNRFALSMPKVLAFFEAVHNSDEGHIRIGAAGFCWGGLHAIRLAHGVSTVAGKPLVDAVFIAHPSNVDIPADFGKVGRPTSLAIGDQDAFLSPETVAHIRDIWHRKRSESFESEIVVYPGAGHGFSVRADPFNEVQAEQSQKAEEQAVKWFDKHLSFKRN